jgi:hypothetical protein
VDRGPRPAAQSPSSAAHDYAEHPMTVDVSAAYALTDAQLAERAAALRAKIAASAIDIGNDLLATKSLIAHGRFVRWVEDEVGFELRQAENYMQVARFAAAHPEVCENEKFSTLKASILYRLAAPSTPAPVVEATLSRIKRGERVKVNEVAEGIRAARMPIRQVESPGPEVIEHTVDELQRCVPHCIDNLVKFGPEVLKALCKRVGVKPPPQRRGQLRPSPTFVAEFADGEQVRMTVACTGGYDWGRGRRLAEAAWRSRVNQIDIEEIPPAIVSCHFEHDGQEVWPHGSI